MLTTPSESFADLYQGLVSSGTIEPDAAQSEVADAFGALEQRLAGYKPPRRQRLFGRLFADKKNGPPPAASMSMARSAAARPC
jgi:cell division protein ZapE